MIKQEVVDYIKENFPTHRTASVADNLNLSISQVRKIARDHGVQKCNKYLKELNV